MKALDFDTKYLLSCWMALLAAIGFASCSSFVMDPLPAAETGRDLTIPISGYGKLASDGYLFLRVHEGDRASGTISMLLPTNLRCGRPSCVAWQITRPDGVISATGGLPEGQHTVTWRLADFIGSDVALSEHDGEYRIVARVYYLNSNGNPASQRIEGLVRVKVLGPEYVLMGCQSPHTAWRRRVSPRCEILYSSRGRTAVCGECS